MRRLAGLLGSAAILGAWLAGCGSGVALAVPFSAEELERIRSLSGLPDVPPQLTNRWADHAGAASLGASLFFDERLSLHGDISCASCHDPDAGWSDGVTVASGLAVGERNTQSHQHRGPLPRPRPQYAPFGDAVAGRRCSRVG